MASSKKWVQRITLQKHFPSKYHHKIYWYDAISTINPIKKLKRALESKLSNFKKFSRTARISSHSLITTINLPPKLLGLWPPFFPSTKFIFVRTNLSCFRGVYFCLLQVGFFLCILHGLLQAHISPTFCPNQESQEVTCLHFGLFLPPLIPIVTHWW